VIELEFTVLIGIAKTALHGQGDFDLFTEAANAGSYGPRR